MQITEVHPYDDAEYASAKCGYSGIGFVEFIKGGKQLPKTLQLKMYNEENFEDEDDYISYAVDTICRKLRELNAYVKPRIVHW